MAPDLWMKGTRMKLNCSKCLLNIANSKSFLLLTLPVHHEYFSHLELPAGATPEEQFLYNLKEKTKFKLILKKKKKILKIFTVKIVSYLQVSCHSLLVKALNRKHTKINELGSCLHSSVLHWDLPTIISRWQLQRQVFNTDPMQQNSWWKYKTNIMKRNF